MDLLVANFVAALIINVIIKESSNFTRTILEAVAKVKA
tara:strand:+ start:722 stop:835 length:114 start_codon:yes stop_codon:yes gene_type:complete